MTVKARVLTYEHKNIFSIFATGTVLNRVFRIVEPKSRAVYSIFHEIFDCELLNIAVLRMTLLSLLVLLLVFGIHITKGSHYYPIILGLRLGGRTKR